MAALASEWLTELGIRIFTTLVHFDAVYHSHFKCKLKRIKNYRNLSNYVRELYEYQWPGLAEMVGMCLSHTTIKPSGIVPVDSLLNHGRAHNRECLRG